MRYSDCSEWRESTLSTMYTSVTKPQPQWWGSYQIRSLRWQTHAVVVTKGKLENVSGLHTQMVNSMEASNVECVLEFFVFSNWMANKCICARILQLSSPFNTSMYFPCFKILLVSILGSWYGISPRYLIHVDWLTLADIAVVDQAIIMVKYRRVSVKTTKVAGITSAACNKHFFVCEIKCKCTFNTDCCH